MDKGLQEFKAELAGEEKLRRWVMTVLNPMIAKKAMHTKEIVTFDSYLERILARNRESLGKRASEEKLRRLKAKLNSMLAKRVKSLLAKEEEAR
jgi:hypothetical protein